jgi:hypothetical protein
MSVPLRTPSIFQNAHVSIDLHFVQRVPFVFAVPGFEAGGILLLGALDGVAEIGIEPRAVVLEERQLFIEARRIKRRVFGPFETFQPADGFVNASIQ